MAERQTLPVLPLRGTVIFPEVPVPITVGRPTTLHATEAALRGDRQVFAVAQRNVDPEPAPDQLFTMGVVARIGQVQRGLGGVQLLLQGTHRSNALHYTQADNHLNATVTAAEEMRPVDEYDPALQAHYC